MQSGHVQTKKICEGIIERPGDSASLAQEHLAPLLKESADQLMKEKNMLSLSGRAIFVGDLHGDLNSALSAFALASKKNAHVIFLGDIVDRGSSQLETINLILARKLLEPDKVYMLRGNHEFREVNSRYGFADAVMGRYGETIYWLYNACFSTFPLAALLSGRVLALHGGVCRDLPTLRELEKIDRASLSSLDEKAGIVWNDPSETKNGFSYNHARGGFHTYGKDVFGEFMSRNKLDMMVRAHQPWPNGYKYFFGKRLISVFSCADCYDIKPKAVMVNEDCQVDILGL